MKATKLARRLSLLARSAKLISLMKVRQFCRAFVFKGQELAKLHRRFHKVEAPAAQRSAQGRPASLKVLPLSPRSLCRGRDCCTAPESAQSAVSGSAVLGTKGSARCSRRSLSGDLPTAGSTGSQWAACHCSAGTGALGWSRLHRSRDCYTSVLRVGESQRDTSTIRRLVLAFNQDLRYTY